jgi:hypothetical protein
MLDQFVGGCEGETGKLGACDAEAVDFLAVLEVFG